MTPAADHTRQANIKCPPASSRRLQLLTGQHRLANEDAAAENALDGASGRRRDTWGVGAHGEVLRLMQRLAPACVHLCSGAVPMAGAGAGAGHAAPSWVLLTP